MITTTQGSTSASTHSDNDSEINMGKNEFSQNTLRIPTSLLTYTGGSTDQRSILLSLALEIQLDTKNCKGK